MPTFLTTPTTISLSGLAANTWLTGVTSGAPASATGAIIAFNFSASHAAAVTTRMNGSTDTQTNGQTSGSGLNQVFMITGLSSGLFDVYSTTTVAGGGITCWLIGYFGPEATFFQNATVLTTLTSSFANYNVASSCPGALAVFVDIFAGGGLTQIRQNGSTDTTNAFSGQSFIVGVDASQIFNAKNGNSLGVPYLKGYITNGITWHTNAVSVGGSFTGGSFQNISAAGGDPGSGILGFVYTSSGTGNFTVCGPSTNTGTYNPQCATIESASAIGQVWAAGQPAQINPASSSQPLSELAYFLPTTAPVSPFSLYGLKPTLAQ